MGETAVKKVVKQFAIAIEKEFSPVSVYLFGSYAKGTANDQSDIDIAVFIKKTDINLLDAWARLFYYRSKIDDRIEPHLLIENEDTLLADEILRTGKAIYC